MGHHGVNQYIENGKMPVEFELIGIKKEKFTLKDVYNIFGFMSFSFAMAQKTDPLLTDIRDKFGSDYLKDFGLNGSLSKTQIKNFKDKSEAYTQISNSISSLLDNSERSFLPMIHTLDSRNLARGMKRML